MTTISVQNCSSVERDIWDFRYGLTPNATFSTSLARRLRAEVISKHGITLEDLGSQKRDVCYVAARFELVTRIRRGCRKWSLPQIARFLGRDHTSICNALKSIRTLRIAHQLWLVHQSYAEVFNLTGVDEATVKAYAAQKEAQQQAALERQKAHFAKLAEQRKDPEVRRLLNQALVEKRRAKRERELAVWEDWRQRNKREAA